MNNIIPRKVIYIVIFIGIILGSLLFFSPGSLLIIFLAIMTIGLINKFSKPDERKFILKLFIIAFIARVVAALVIAFFAISSGHILNYHFSHGLPNYSTPYIIDDSGYYTLRSQFTSMYWKDEPLSEYTMSGVVKNNYGFTGFIYLLAWYFTLFGYSPISSQFFNCLFGALNAILIYYITKDIFGKNTARIAAILTAFFPSLFLWSITNLKETSFTFVVYLTIWAVNRLVKTMNIFYLPVVLLSLWLQYMIRYGYRDFIYATITILLLYCLYLVIDFLYKRKKIIPILALTIFICSLLFLEKNKFCLYLDEIKYKALTQHRGVIDAGGNCYKLLPEKFLENNFKGNIDNINFLNMLGQGWFHFMLEPLPSRGVGTVALFIFPQMFIWYTLLLFAILGIGIAIRYRFRYSFILILYFFIIGSILAVAGGNIGTIFRLRDFTTPTILIFSSVGLINIFNYLDFKDCEERSTA